MFYLDKCAQRQIALACFLLVISGCHAVDCLHHAPKGEQFLGAVRTGGPLASAKTLPIPLHGLTLADAVEESIRPGLLVAAGGVTTAPAVLPVGEQRLSLYQNIRALIGQIRPSATHTGELVAADLAAAIDLAVTDLLQKGDQSPELKKELENRLKEAADNGLFSPVQNNAAENARLEREYRVLHQDIEAIIHAPVPNADNPHSLTQLAPPTTTDTIAVRLTRRAGNRIIIPLPMVRNYAPGDIWLADGDHVQILPLGMTEAGQLLPNLNGQPVSAIAGSEETPGVNLLILTHTSLLDGRPEEYLLPARNQDYYGNAAFVAQWQNAIFQQGPDQLKAGSLEMNAMIRKSQINTVSASAAALEERMNPSVETMSVKLHRKLERCTAAVCSLPVISQVRNQMQQTVGPLSPGDSIQQATGFDSEEFCRRLTP